MVTKTRNYSLFVSVIVLLFIFYSPLFNIKLDRGVFCLTDLHKINKIDGKITSSPVKCSNEKYYSTNILLNKVSTKSNETFSCNGLIKVYIPAKIIEAYFPEKLYSSSHSKKNCIYETGGQYCLSGFYKNNSFYVSECLSNSWENSLKGKIEYLRAMCRLQFKRCLASWGSAGGLLLALLCGSREYTDTNISNAFQLSGLSHILALSGMHLSMFSGIAMFFGKKSKRKKLNFTIRFLTLIIFVWFAGVSPSLLRAFICALLVMLFSYFDEKSPDMLSILCLSFILQIMISPADLKSLGFILSYGALAGIILFNKFFQIIFIKIMPKYPALSLASSTSAQAFTIPISLKNFGFYSPIGIIATCFISPLITAYIYSGLIFIILSFIFPFISNIGGIFMNFQYNIINYLVLIFSKVPNWRLY